MNFGRDAHVFLVKHPICGVFSTEKYLKHVKKERKKAGHQSEPLWALD